MGYFSSHGNDPDLLGKIEDASEAAVRFSTFMDFSEKQNHLTAVENHRYVLRLIGSFYNLIRAVGVDIGLEKELKALFVLHQEYLRSHQKVLSLNNVTE